MPKTNLFRIWNPDLKVMIMPEDDRSYEYKLLPTGECYNDGIREYCIPLFYTGIQDINGIKIFEGDVLKLPNSDIPIIEVKPLELMACDAFIDYGYNFCSGYYMNDNFDINLDGFYDSNPIIIGNIYENPKLKSDLSQLDNTRDL